MSRIKKNKDLPIMKSNNYNLSVALFPKVELFDPLIEAIINSILSNSPNITVKTERELDKITSITVEDDGCGFVKQCRNSFNEIANSNKQNKKCKGLGRLSWFRVFNKIHIESFFIENNQKMECIFDFDSEFVQIPEEAYKKTDKEFSKSKTTIKFYDINEDFINRDELCYDGETILSNIINRILPNLLKENCILTIDQAPPFSLNNLDWLVDTKYQIKAEGVDFTISYAFYTSKADRKTDNHFLYLSNGRGVKPFFTELSDLSFDDNKKIIVIVESELLNVTTADWKRFGMEKDKWHRINNSVQNIVSKMITDLTGNNRVVNNKEQAGLKRPELKPFIEKVNDGIAFQSIAAIIKEAEKLSNEAIVKCLDDSEMFNGENINAIQLKALGELALSRYKTLRNAVKICNDDNVKEEEIHNLLFTQRTDSNSIKDNNLWLLDARWQYTEYTTSEQSIADIFDKNLDIEQIYKKHKLLLTEEDTANIQKDRDKFMLRPDICIFNNDSVVIVELKKPGVDLAFHIEKIKLYGSLISFISKQKYRNIYGYLLGKERPTLVDKFYKEDYDGLGYSFVTELSIFQNGKTKRTTLDETTFYGSILEYNKFLKDCYFQHKPFFEKINKQIAELEAFMPTK